MAEKLGSNTGGQRPESLEGFVRLIQASAAQDLSDIPVVLHTPSDRGIQVRQTFTDAEGHYLFKEVGSLDKFKVLFPDAYLEPKESLPIKLLSPEEISTGTVTDNAGGRKKIVAPDSFYYPDSSTSFLRQISQQLTTLSSALGDVAGNISLAAEELKTTLDNLKTEFDTKLDLLATKLAPDGDNLADPLQKMNSNGFKVFSGPQLPASVEEQVRAMLENNKQEWQKAKETIALVVDGLLDSDKPDLTAFRTTLAETRETPKLEIAFLADTGRRLKPENSQRFLTEIKQRQAATEEFIVDKLTGLAVATKAKGLAVEAGKLDDLAAALKGIFG